MYRYIKKICNSYYVPGLLTALFIVGTGIAENRGLKGPYTEQEVIHHQVTLTGKHITSGRGLSYEVLYDNQAKHDINVKGYNFNSINNHSSLGFGSPINNDDLHVGLVTTDVDDVYHAVYVKAGDDVLLPLPEGLNSINASNADSIQWRIYTSLLAFVFITLFFKYLKKAD